MRALAFAWRSLVRQPARAALGVLGVAAVGALLFDMLMLSQGLIVSMRDLLERGGWDVRVSAGELPGEGPRLQDASTVAQTISALPSVRAVLRVRGVDARFERPGASHRSGSLQGATVLAGPTTGSVPGMPWTLVRGRDVESADELVVSELTAETLGVSPGDRLTVQVSCSRGPEALPGVERHVVGIATFPFEAVDALTAGGTMAGVTTACGGPGSDEADLLLVASTDEPDRTAADIRRLLPGVNVATNAEVLGRLREAGFTYFRQISSVLTTVTVSFAVLLITVLLTVSVNQRLGEVAALRALGFSRTRVVKDVVCESGLIVGLGGVLSLPLGVMLAEGLDRILKSMPGIPSSLHFFVFEGRILALHAALLVATAVVAALYPARLVSRLPIAATLRDEVVG